MTKLPDLGAVYAEFSSWENRLVKFTILDEQGKETQHLLLDSAQNTIEEIQEFMDLVEKHLKRSMD
jgi:DNA-directed RNA polymerase subunit L